MTAAGPKINKIQKTPAQKPTGGQRVAQSSAAKVLRIGIIQSGKIIEERIIRNRESVTVGPSEKNTFVLATSGLPNRFDMFEMKAGSGYILHFTDAMTGKLSSGGKVQDVEELKSSGVAKRKGKTFQLALKEEARGKLVVGDSTVLFQFVTPPPIQPRPQLPAAVRGGVFKNMEMFISVMYAISLILHLAFFTYLEVTDWPVQSQWDKFMAYQELVAPTEATFEKKKKSEEKFEDAEGEAEEEEDVGKKKQNKKAPSKKAADEDTGPKRSAEEVARERAEKRAALAKQLAERGINKILGTIGGQGEGAIVDVLRGGDVGADQDELLSQVSGVGVATGDNTGHLRGPAGGKGSGEAADINSMKVKGGDADVKTAGPGRERTIKGRVRKKNPSAVDGTGMLNPKEVAKVVNRRIGAIKGCYERALRRNPTLEGKITIRFTVAGSGKVTSARATTNELGGDVGGCITSAFKRFRFPPPDGGSATFEYPFLFTPAG